MTTGSVFVAAVFAALYVVFLVWYCGRGKPLSNAEVDALLSEMRKPAGRCRPAGVLITLVHAFCVMPLLIPVYLSSCLTDKPSLLYWKYCQYPCQNGTIIDFHAYYIYNNAHRSQFIINGFNRNEDDLFRTNSTNCI